MKYISKWLGLGELRRITIQVPVASLGCQVGSTGNLEKFRKCKISALDLQEAAMLICVMREHCPQASGLYHLLDMTMNTHCFFLD